MVKIKLESLAEKFVLIMAFILPNLGVGLCLSDLNNPLSFCSFKNFPIEIIFDILAVSGAIWLMIRRSLHGVLIGKVRKNILLIAFCVFSLASILWSVNPLSSVFHVVVMISVSVLAAYFAISYTSDQNANFLYIFAGVVVLASVGLVLIYPNAAIMGEPHPGSWRGIFWHKNFTGSLMAFASMIFLFKLFTSTWQQKGWIVINALLYLISLIFIFKSLSAAGVAIWAIMNFCLIVLILWNKLRNVLTRMHYMIIFGTVLILIIVAFLNINVFFNLLNRESNLTGRIPLWNYLISSSVSQQPIIGHGFGAAFSLESFRQQVTLHQRWGFEINNGHNGFMDILLNLGGIGLFLVTAIFILAFIRTWKFFFRSKRFEDVFPFLLVTYVFLANLTISFLLDVESFHWFLLIVALFIATQPSKKGNLSEKEGHI